MLSPKSAFVWEEPQREAFRQARRLLREVPIRAFYDPAKPVTLLTDATHARGLGTEYITEGENARLQYIANGPSELMPEKQ